MKNKWFIAAAIILVMVMICGAMIFVMQEPLKQLLSGNLRSNVIGPGSLSAESTEEKILAVNAPIELNIQNDFGFIKVTGADVEQVKVSSVKTAWGWTQAEAEAELAKIKINITQAGNTIDISNERAAEFPLFVNQQASRVDFTITVPLKATITAATASGNISLEKVEGNATLRTDFGNITLAELSGNSIKVATSSGSVNLSMVNAINLVELSGGFGSLEYRNGQAGSLSVKTGNGEVRLQDLSVDGEVTVRSDFGAITLDGVSAKKYNLGTGNGRIDVRGASGQIIATTDFGDIDVSQSQKVDINLATKSGALSFEGSLGNGPHSFQNEFGSISLRLPQDSAFAFDLETNLGKISSDFPVNIEGQPDESHWMGRVGVGGPKLAASTSSGNISIQISNQ